jgi:hypothetical protein
MKRKPKAEPKVKAPKQMAPSMAGLRRVSASWAWEILWRTYIKALKSGNMARAERVKKQIDSFDKNWLK